VTNRITFQRDAIPLIILCSLGWKNQSYWREIWETARAF